jgi:hypothetical protein
VGRAFAALATPGRISVDDVIRDRTGPDGRALRRPELRSVAIPSSDQPEGQRRRSARPQSWQRNLYALTAACFLMFTAFGFVFPFLPLFIAQLGVGDVQQVEIWSGVSSFGQSIVLAVFSPSGARWPTVAADG